MILDTRTLLLSYFATDLICLAVIILLWRQNRERVGGTHLWIIDYAFKLSGLILMILRGAVPDWASILLANALILASWLIGYEALLRFAGETRRQAFNYLVVAASLLIQIYFTFIQPDMNARIINVSAALVMIVSQCAWFCLRGAPEARRGLMWWTGLVFVLFALVNLGRIATAVFAPLASGDFFQDNLSIALSMIAQQLLFVALTFALSLMYNQRLNEEIRTEEEKYSTAFRFSPYALILLSLPDGKILEVNEGFSMLSGYDETEIRGKTTRELGLWVSEEDRRVILHDIMKEGSVADRKLKFRKRSGEILTGLFSMQTVDIRNERCLLASFNDITKQEKAEEEMRAAQVQWQKTFDATNDAIWLLDRDQRILRSNEAAQRLFAQQKEEMTGRFCWEIVHGTSAPIPACPILRARESLRRESMDISVAGKWYLATVDPLLDDEGRFAGAVHTMTDISERRQAEEEIRRLNQALERKIADQNPLLSGIVST